MQFWELQDMVPWGSLLLHNRCSLLHAHAHMGLAWWEAFHVDELIASSEQALSGKGLPTVSYCTRRGGLAHLRFGR